MSFFLIAVSSTIDHAPLHYRFPSFYKVTALLPPPTRQHLLFSPLPPGTCSSPLFYQAPALLPSSTRCIPTLQGTRSSTPPSTRCPLFCPTFYQAPAILLFSVYVLIAVTSAIVHAALLSSLASFQTVFSNSINHHSFFYHSPI